jgi:adenylate kinase
MIRSTVVGLYGISGSGKSRALSKAAKLRPEWRCLEGSEVIKEVLEEKALSFDDFQGMDEMAKGSIRSNATRKIRTFKGVSIVAGHYSFPLPGDELVFRDVFNKDDAQTYSYIFYLERDVQVIFQQRKQDNLAAKRTRSQLSIDALEKWIGHEQKMLERDCKTHNIRFGIIKSADELISRMESEVMPPLVKEVQMASEQALCSAVELMPSSDVYLLLDGDRTLCPLDTGRLFFEDARLTDRFGDDPLKRIFKRYAGYTFQAFLEVAMLYERALSQSDYEELSKRIGTNDVDIYPQWIRFLSNLPPTVHAILVSSGNREVWRAALGANGVLANSDKGTASSKISIVAGNHTTLHPYVLDNFGKAMVATALRRKSGGCKILSFGDSGKSIRRLEASLVLDQPGCIVQSFFYVLVVHRS